MQTQKQIRHAPVLMPFPGMEPARNAPVADLRRPPRGLDKGCPGLHHLRQSQAARPGLLLAQTLPYVLVLQNVTYAAGRLQQPADITRLQVAQDVG